MPPAAAALDGGQRVAEPAAPMQQEIFLKDYSPPRYLIDNVHLSFQLWEEATHVVSKLSVRPSHPEAEAAPPMFLHGRADVQLDGVKVDDQEWPPGQYQLTDRSLTLLNLPAAAFTLEIRTTIMPQENTLLQGLYKSSGMYCTQCEAEGFRGITFFHDLPDVLSVYTTHLEADRALYPVLLSNGNLIDSGSVPGNDGRHFAVFQDPWPKPCYLFALVAGQLGWREDSFTTMGGRKVQLRIYTREEDVPRTAYAMESLVTAMRWDEERFGREYDLNVLNVVAVDDFNMGAMENKGLMVFNSARILACPKTAVDDDFFMVQRVMAHEYFHNWTGNRVTVRDWFQLTLKEGLTVFRDQEFSSDLHSRAVRRIRDVSFLRTTQFPEDAGSMAHPVRPLSYVKMDNFYTSTVYKKGAEVVRLYHTLLGRDGFRKGMDLYFQRHDGQAVTCEEFLAAHADANSADLAAVACWYGQAGTPHLRVTTEYSPAQKTFTIRTQQSTPPTPGQPTKGPVMIPLAVGLLSPDGTDIPIRLQGSSKEPCSTLILPCSNDSDEFVIEGCEAAPVPSLLRNFSAPVVMTVEGQTEEDLLFLMHNDSDMFNRWDSAQRLCMSRMLALYHSVVTPDAEVESQLAAAGGVGAELAGAFRKLLEEEGQDRGFVAASITLPGHIEMMARLPQADPLRCHKVRQSMRKELSQRLEPQLRAAVQANDSQPGEAFSPSFEQQSRRALKNAALSLLAASGKEEMWEELALRFRAATNMTDQLAALRGLLGARSPQREQCLQEFFDQWQSDRLVMNKWFQEQACCSLEGNLGAVRKLTEHPSFSITNPNNCYGLLRGFAASPPNFHAADGSGYTFLANMILKVDKVNGVAASKICLVFTSHAQYCRAHQELMLKEVKRIAATDGVSENVLEITNRCLAA